MMPYILTFIFVGVGFMLAIVASKLANINNGPLFVSLIFAPIIAFLVLSGQLSEFKGFGVEAKFREFGEKPIKTTAASPITIEPTSGSVDELIAKSEVKAIFGIGQEVVLLKATSGETDRKVGVREVFQVAAQIYPSLLQGVFEFLVVIDDSNRVLGYFEKEFFFDLLRIEILQTIRGTRTEYQKDRVAEQLQQTQLWDIVENPRMRANSWGLKDTVRVNESNVEALHTMAEMKLSAIVAVDRQGKYKGIVKRNDIVSDLLLELYESPPRGL